MFRFKKVDWGAQKWSIWGKQWGWTLVEFAHNRNTLMPTSRPPVSFQMLKCMPSFYQALHVPFSRKTFISRETNFLQKLYPVFWWFSEWFFQHHPHHFFLSNVETHATLLPSCACSVFSEKINFLGSKFSADTSPYLLIFLTHSKYLFRWNSPPLSPWN